jgi:hypothetical protein
MSNTETVQAIITNIETILTNSTLAFKLEDMSDDEKLKTIDLAKVIYTGEEFEESYGERNLYNEIEFLIVVQYTDPNPAARRDKNAVIVHKIRDNITIDALNVGFLASTKLVSRVEHVEAKTGIDQTTNTINYILKVRYREI